MSESWQLRDVLRLDLRARVAAGQHFQRELMRAALGEDVALLRGSRSVATRCVLGTLLREPQHRRTAVGPGVDVGPTLNQVATGPWAAAMCNGGTPFEIGASMSYVLRTYTPHARKVPRLIAPTKPRSIPFFRRSGSPGTPRPSLWSSAPLLARAGPSPSALPAPEAARERRGRAGRRHGASPCSRA